MLKILDHYGPTTKGRFTMTLLFQRRKIPDRVRTAIALLLIDCIIPLGSTNLYAQQAPPADACYVQRDDVQLNQLVAPIALYPDSLVAQILAAATYSTEVSEAHRFLQQHLDRTHEELVRMVDGQAWDPCVKALTAFPSVLSDLDQN